MAYLTGQRHEDYQPADQALIESREGDQRADVLHSPSLDTWYSSNWRSPAPILPRYFMLTNNINR